MVSSYTQHTNTQFSTNNFINILHFDNWRRFGRSGDRIPVWARFSASVQTRWGPTNFLYDGYQVFPGVKSGRVVTLTPHPILVPWSRKGRASTLLPLWAVRPVQSLSVCTRVHFTFTFYILTLILNLLFKT
jgi:hypothetical protein